MENAPEATASDTTLTAGLAPQESAATAPAEGHAPVQNGSWFGAYSEDTQSLITNRGYDKLDQSAAFEDLANGYKNLQSKLGGSHDELFAIKPDMSDDDRIKAYRALGMPEDTNGYSYETRDNDSPELVDAFKGAAHKYGLTDKQMSGLLNDMNPVIEGMSAANVQVVKQKNLAGLESLRDEWAGSWDAKVSIATRAAEHFGISQEVQQAMVDSGHSAEFLKSLNQMGSLMAEGAMVGMSATDQKASIGAMSKSEAQAEISKLQGDPEFRARLQSSDRPTAEAASKEMEKFYKILSNS